MKFVDPLSTLHCSHWTSLQMRFLRYKETGEATIYKSLSSKSILQVYLEETDLLKTTIKSAIKAFHNLLSSILSKLA